MQDKEMHSSVKILKNSGNASEVNIGIVTLVETIQESNSVSKEMFEEIKRIREDAIIISDIRKETDNSIKEHDRILLLQIKDQTETISNGIVVRVKEIIENVNKYLLLKIATGTIIATLIISYLFGHYNTDKIEAIEITLKTITTHLGIEDDTPK